MCPLPRVGTLTLAAAQRRSLPPIAFSKLPFPAVELRKISNLSEFYLKQVYVDYKLTNNKKKKKIGKYVVVLNFPLYHTSVRLISLSTF